MIKPPPGPVDHYVKRGVIYELIKPLVSFPVGQKIRVFGKRWGGLAYDGVSGWEISTDVGVLVIDKKRWKAFLRNPESYLRKVGEFDAQALQKELARSLPETGFGEFVDRTSAELGSGSSSDDDDSA